MTTATAALFFAILSLAALGGAIALAVLLMITRGMDRAAPATALEQLRVDVSRAALPLAWLVATVTTLGSLYFSEVAHYIPCALCWYQRIAMYPLVLLLGIATFRRDRSIRVYVIAQCAVGACISIYHSFVQAFPPDNGTSFCTAEAPCTTRYVWEFGFVSLPFMALTAFLFIIAAMFVLGPALEPATATTTADAATATEAAATGGAGAADAPGAAAAVPPRPLAPGAPR